MQIFLLEFLDVFFFLFHTALVFFNILGWILPQTRKLHLISMGGTLLSWVGLGFWYGWGYCICTDWHWQVLSALGRRPMVNGYIQYLIQVFTGITPPAGLTAVATAWTFIVLLIITAGINLWDFFIRKKGKSV